MSSSAHIEKVGTGSFSHNDRSRTVYYLIDTQDNNEFDVIITYTIVGVDVPPQELQLALQSTR